MPSTCLIIGAGASKIIGLHGKDKRNIFLGEKIKEYHPSKLTCDDI
jgi:hypothetical protein